MAAEDADASLATAEDSGRRPEPGFALPRPAAATQADSSARRPVVVNPAGVDNDIVRDVTKILTSPCGRLHGPGPAAERAAGALAAAKSGDG
jgi:hypothetical protein